MADDPHKSSEMLEQEVPAADSPKEDAETKATREELKQTVISDKSTSTPAAEEMDKDSHADPSASPRETTPQRAGSADSGDALKEQVSSPKKKRAHDELDEHKDGGEPASVGQASENDANGGPAASRTNRSEPEKKRPRDEPGEDLKKTVTVELHAHPAADASKLDDAKPAVAQPSGEADVSVGKTEPSSTSASAFAASGFSKLSNAASPFGALGGAGSKAGGFGGLAAIASSPFGALAAGSGSTAAAPTLSFDKDAKSSAASPFATLNGAASKPFGSTFGSGFGSGFGGGFGGSKLTSFAKPGADLKKSDKPAKPFGAPDSGNEDSSDEEEDDDAEDSSPDEPETDEKEPEEPKPSAVAEDKKKTRLQKVVLDDGESGETSIFTGRAKVYQLDKATSSWKEKGAGILKINVPEASIDYDDQTNAPLPNTFDASVLSTIDDADVKTPRLARLLMRQDHTHRVVLNTAILAATDFIERESLKSTMFIFTSFEGPEAKAVSLQLKMSQPNAKLFISMIKLIQAELRSSG